MRAIVGLFAVLACAGLHAQPVPPAATQGDLAVKVRLTLSLARFTQWPSESAAGEPVRLCVLHKAPEVLEAFRAQQAQALNGRRLLVSDAAGPDGAACQVLFVHASGRPVAAWFEQTVRQSTLTVGDADGFLASGGMVELVAVNDAIRFDVNLAALRAARLTLSSQVLRLARRVRE